MKKILLLLSIILFTLNSCKDNCKDINCLNYGICVDGTCDCPEGYSGEKCEINDCDDITCENNGVCVNGECRCPEGYSGDNCEIAPPPPPCENVICENGGVCDNGTCNCPDGYEGTNCENTASKKFQGEYNVICNGVLDIDGTNQNFVDEPAIVKIYQGEKSDEIIMYVELEMVTDAIPMVVEAEGEVDGLEYEMDPTQEIINVSVAGVGINLSFIVSATGELSEDFQTLESDVVFSGDLNGTINCVGVKQ